MWSSLGLSWHPSTSTNSGVNDRVEISVVFQSVWISALWKKGAQINKKPSYSPWSRIWLSQAATGLNFISVQDQCALLFFDSVYLIPLALKQWQIPNLPSCCTERVAIYISSCDSASLLWVFVRSSGKWHVATRARTKLNNLRDSSTLITVRNSCSSCYLSLAHRTVNAKNKRSGRFLKPQLLCVCVSLCVFGGSGSQTYVGRKWQECLNMDVAWSSTEKTE